MKALCGAYFGLTCGDKVITSLPVLLSGRFNMKFQSSSYDDVTSISDSVKAGAPFASISAQISKAFQTAGSAAKIKDYGCKYAASSSYTPFLPNPAITRFQISCESLRVT